MKNLAKKINENVRVLLESIRKEFKLLPSKINCPVQLNPEQLEKLYTNNSNQENFSLLIHNLASEFKLEQDPITPRQLTLVRTLIGNILHRFRDHHNKNSEFKFSFLNDTLTLGQTILPLIANPSLNLYLSFQIYYNSIMSWLIPGNINSLKPGNINNPEFYLALEEGLRLKLNCLPLQIEEFAFIQAIFWSCNQKIKTLLVTEPLKLVKFLFGFSEKAFQTFRQLAELKDTSDKNEFYFQFFFYFVDLLLLLPLYELDYASPLMQKVHNVMKFYNKTILSEEDCFVIAKKLVELAQNPALPSAVNHFFNEISINFIPDCSQNKNFEPLKISISHFGHNKFIQDCKHIPTLINQTETSVLPHKMKNTSARAQAAWKKLQDSKSSNFIENYTAIDNFFGEALELYSKTALNTANQDLEDNIFMVSEYAYSTHDKENDLYKQKIKLAYRKSFSSLKQFISEPDKINFCMEEVTSDVKLTTPQILWKIHFYVLWNKETIEYIKSHEKNISIKNYNFVISKIFYYTFEIFENLLKLKDLKEKNHLTTFSKAIYLSLKLTILLQSTVRYHNDQEFIADLFILFLWIKKLIEAQPKINLTEGMINKLLQNTLNFAKNPGFENTPWAIQNLVEISQYFTEFHKTSAILQLKENLDSLIKDFPLDLTEKKESRSYLNLMINNILNYDKLVQSNFEQKGIEIKKNGYKTALEICQRLQNQEIKESIKILKPISEILNFFHESTPVLESSIKIQGFNLIDSIYRFFGQSEDLFIVMLNAKQKQINWCIEEKQNPLPVNILLNQFLSIQSTQAALKYPKLLVIMNLMEPLQLYTEILIQEKDQYSWLILEKLVKLTLEMIQLCQVISSESHLPEPILTIAQYSKYLRQALNSMGLIFNYFPLEKELQYLTHIGQMILDINCFMEKNLLKDTTYFINFTSLIKPDAVRLARYPGLKKYYGSLINQIFSHAQTGIKENSKNPELNTDQESLKKSIKELETALEQKNKEKNQLGSQIQKLQEQIKQNHADYQIEDKRIEQLKAELVNSKNTLESAVEKNQNLMTNLLQNKQIEIKNLKQDYLSSLKYEKETSEKTYTRLQKKIESIHLKINETEREIQNAQECLKDQLTRLEQQERQYQKINSAKIKEKQAKLVDAHKSIQYLEHSLNETKHSLKKQETELEENDKVLNSNDETRINFANKFQIKNTQIRELLSQINKAKEAGRLKKQSQRAELNSIRQEIALFEQAYAASLNSTAGPRFSFSNPSPATLSPAPVYYVP